jgi:dTDP-4-amino-4,6-dideoxygalactose transaminase
LDELQAAILRVKLKYLERWNEARRKKAKIYREILAPLGVVCPSEELGVKHVYHLYVIRVKERDKLQVFLKKKGIETLVHYPVPIHLQKAYEDLGYRQGDLPLTEQCCSEILSLPFFPEMKESEIRIVAQEIRSFFEKNGANDTE